MSGLSDFFSSIADSVGGLFDGGTPAPDGSSIADPTSGFVDPTSPDLSSSIPSLTQNSNGSYTVGGSSLLKTAGGLIGAAASGMNNGNGSNSLMQRPNPNPLVSPNRMGTQSTVAQNNGQPAQAANAQALNSYWLNLMKQFASAK